MSPNQNTTPVSIVLLAYNQEGFVRDAVRSVLAQTFTPLELVFSDDRSKDRTFAVIEEETAAYRGPSRIILNRNPRNMGLAAHLHHAASLSSGSFIIIQAGDDISVPTRVEKLYRRWTQSPHVDLVCSYFEEIDVQGRPTGYIKKAVSFVPDVSRSPLEWACGATGACAAYSRRLLQKYGPVNDHVLSEDWVYSFRAWLESGIAVVEEPLLQHRTHEASLAVIERTVKQQRDVGARRRIRRRGAENRLGIAQEWLRAWQIQKPKDDPVLPELQRLVRLRELQFRAHDASRLGAFKIAATFKTDGGSWADTARILVRHVARWS